MVQARKRATRIIMTMITIITLMIMIMITAMIMITTMITVMIIIMGTDMRTITRMIMRITTATANRSRTSREAAPPARATKMPGNLDGSVGAAGATAYCLTSASYA